MNSALFRSIQVEESLEGAASLKDQTIFNHEPQHWETRFDRDNGMNRRSLRDLRESIIFERERENTEEQEEEKNVREC